MVNPTASKAKYGTKSVKTGYGLARLVTVPGRPLEPVGNARPRQMTILDASRVQNSAYEALRFIFFGNSLSILPFALFTIFH